MPVGEHNALNRLFRENDCYSEGKSFLLLSEMRLTTPEDPYPRALVGFREPRVSIQPFFFCD
jgi:hypothetical protein